MSAGPEREPVIPAGGGASAGTEDLDSFSPAGRAAILGLLVTLGDNKYRLGRRYSEWATAGPTLEASVAAASMTSDEMGHARSLYPLLKRFPGAPPELRREEDRSEFHNVSFLDEPFASWTDLIAACALFGRALNTVVASLRSSSYSPLRHRAGKILQEERYHGLYADGWVEILSRGDEGRAGLEESLRRIWPETLAWFGPDDDPLLRAAAAERITDADGPTLRLRFAEGVAGAVGRLSGIELSADEPIPWERWDRNGRRLVPA